MTSVLESLVSEHNKSARVCANVLLAGVLAALALLVAITAFQDQRPPAPDFYYAYFPAAHRLLGGTSPYAVPRRDIAAGMAFVYPALSAVVFAPLALVGRSLADHVYVLFCFLLVPTTLWVANVRDWRVYGLPLLWAPVAVGWEGGNVSVPLTCLVALAWKYRDRPAVAGLIAAVAISLKPFMWPLALWLLATRRWRAAAYALLSGVVTSLLAWAVVGFNQIGTYLRLSRQVTDALWRGGYSVLAAAHHVGFGRGAGEVLLVAGSLALAAGVVYLGSVKRREGEAMIIAVALMLVASPLVWSHYFVLLLVPLALARPRFDAVWFLPCAMWICPPAMTATGREVALAWLVAAFCVLTALRSGPVGERSADRRPEGRPPDLVMAA